MKNYIKLTALFTFTFAVISCGDKNSENQAVEKLPVVKVQRVDNRDVLQIGTYTATVEPENINNISSSTPNRIK